MISRTDITAVILAGGPAQKAGGVVASTLEVEGRKVLERQVQILKPKVSRIEVSVSAPAPWSRFPIVLDSFDPIGPLAGIATALKYASTDYILAIAGHYAWLHPDALDLLIARSGEPFDACAVRFNFATPKPQFAIYHKRCAQRAVERIERGDHDAEGLLTSESLAVRWIEDYELQSFDPELSTFKVLGGATPSATPVTPSLSTTADSTHAFAFQALEVYQSAIAFLPLAAALAKLAHPELAAPLVRAALAITVGIAENALPAARTQTLACAALLDGLRALGLSDPKIAEGHALLARILEKL